MASIKTSKPQTNRISTSLIYLLLALTGLMAFISNASSNEDIANERPPINASALQNHWKVDCPKIQTQLINASRHHSALQVLWNDANQLHENLLLCSIIHDRFWQEAAPCNPFKVALKWQMSISPADKRQLTDSDQKAFKKALTCIPLK